MTRHVRRVVTSLDPGDALIVHSNWSVAMTVLSGADPTGAVVWTTSDVPADNVADLLGDTRDAGLSLKGDTVLRVTEFRPRFVFPDTAPCR